MNKRGFTLIELILGVAIVSVISLAMLTVISNNFNFLEKSKEMSKNTFLAQQEIELEISSLKGQLKDSGHGLSMESITIDGIEVTYHHINKLYHDEIFQYVVTPEQLPEYILLKTYDVKAQLKTGLYDAESVYAITTTSIEGSNTPDPATLDDFWMLDVRQWYVSREGFYTPTPKGDGTDPNYKFFDYLEAEGLENQIGKLYPSFPDDYILLGTETEVTLDDLLAYGGRHVVYKVTPAAKSGKLGIPEVSDPVYISGLKDVSGLVLHLDASYLDPSNGVDVSSSDQLLRWNDLSSAIGTGSISQYGLASDLSSQPLVVTGDEYVDFLGRYVTYGPSTNTIIQNQGTDEKFVYLYVVSKGDEGRLILTNGSSQTLTRSPSDLVLSNGWSLSQTAYYSDSNTFSIGNDLIKVAELVAYAFDVELSPIEKTNLDTSVFEYFKGKYLKDLDLGDLEEIYPVEMTVFVGEDVTPPVTLIGRYSTGNDYPVEIQWQDDGPIDTSSPATVIRNGHAKLDNTIFARMTVEVLERNLEVTHAKMLSQTLLEVGFAEEISDVIDTSKIKVNDQTNMVSHIEKVVGSDQIILVFLKDTSLPYHTSSPENTIYFDRGSVHHKIHGQVKINNDQDYQVLGTNLLMFEDNFETVKAWKSFDGGSFAHIVDPTNNTNHVIEKSGDQNDPSGAVVEIPSFTSQTYIFEGMIMRPSGTSGGSQDRLSISEVNHSLSSPDIARGYGFGITGSNIYIERRTGGGKTTISSQVTYTRPDDEWFRFLFKHNSDDTIDLYIFDQTGAYQAKVFISCDSSYGTYDGIVIHGGYEFYLDNIKLFTY